MNQNAHTCANCQRTTDQLLLKDSGYQCPGCGFEMAYIDVAPNGNVRGVFGYLKSVGEVIENRYQIEKVLGRGGFGATYLVEDLRLKGKRRALKEVPELLFDEHEVNVLSNLRHPAIPDIIDRFISVGMIYLVLEFGGRRTLGSQCQALGGRIPLANALQWMRQLCDVMIYLHSQVPPVIHRDLKPENILLDDNDGIMLIDFGISKVSTGAAGTTRVMAHAASHGFSPPEQVMGTGTDERSDIYSFGTTFYYLLTGQVPPAAHERIAGSEIQPPSQLAPGLPPELDEILLSCMSLNINQRPRSVADLKQRVETLENFIVPELPQTSKTVRFSPTGRTATVPPVPGSLPGIRIITAEPILPKAESPSNQRKQKGKFFLALGMTAMAAFVFGIYLFLDYRNEVREKKDEPIPVTQPSLPLVDRTAAFQNGDDNAATTSPGVIGGTPTAPATPVMVGTAETVMSPTPPMTGTVENVPPTHTPSITPGSATNILIERLGSGPVKKIGSTGSGIRKKEGSRNSSSDKGRETLPPPQRRF